MWTTLDLDSYDSDDLTAYERSLEKDVPGYKRSRRPESFEPDVIRLEDVRAKGKKRERKHVAVHQQ